MRVKHFLIICILISSCKPELKHIGDQNISIFKDTNLYFDMNLKNDSLKNSSEILRLDAGRILVKKVKLPNYELQPKVTVKVSLTSNGDPWDKSGSLFIIPSSANLNLLNFENKTMVKTQFKDSFPGIKTVKIKNQIYKPNVELLRFMTPFGVGHFNTDKRVETLKPVYIPKWEDEVVW